MEKESFFTGYCRQTDNSRTVAAVTEDGRLLEADCCFTSCLYAAQCPIGRAIAALLKG